ncbi:hypothetical protein SAMN05518865_11256 [Duganella sp. CF458]|uniref:hypothetical protein n=1 Tax=Duganella sp. CF458 TaxID=1884368 RepID=UPI0008EE46F5|nr:hypothetical protein [Duganella sp. CF458]SFG43780.1 hypothetical protein SAMN05518865_11256 [Duganella sp. CF458]
MKFVTIETVNSCLSQIDMRIGEWNQITDNQLNGNNTGGWLNYAAPKDSHMLFKFSEHVAGWLPKGKWKILQIDNSTYLDAVQENFLGQFLRVEGAERLSETRSLLFEFGASKRQDQKLELLIAQLIFIFLLFECHVHVVSSGSVAGQLLSIQDGFVYFQSREMNVQGAELLLDSFRRNPDLSPEWVGEIVAEDQERRLDGIIER